MSLIWVYHDKRNYHWTCVTLNILKWHTYVALIDSHSPVETKLLPREYRSYTFTVFQWIIIKIYFDPYEFKLHYLRQDALLSIHTYIVQLKYLLIRYLPVYNNYLGIINKSSIKYVLLNFFYVYTEMHHLAFIYLFFGLVKYE